MLFHVTAQHDHQTCEGEMRARGGDVAPRKAHLKFADILPTYLA